MPAGICVTGTGVTGTGMPKVNTCVVAQVQTAVVTCVEAAHVACPEEEGYDGKHQSK
jgi:hypothetical protein